MSQIKTLQEFRDARTIMTREEYNETFGNYFETNPDSPEYDPEIQYIVTYPCGSHIELVQRDCKVSFSMCIMRSEYHSESLQQLEERLWDDFSKIEGYQLSGEEIENDYRSRMHILMEKPSVESYEKAMEIFQKLVKLM